ncbi:uncharacterized protein EI97DRAFT_443624 [Westerdykella ornata]|uniref:Uncharacterized protein n=1 Tax=Westerdykella ornata TaxID=318751 RepID=A0A6A6JFY5_WESOR|nr:uncharacterized protein EI97DRAFT_443624 [Westerdykella ornata]KAF2275063.1 hypothetical protein EI97DRAFT_443624 [Westerdykella ornata]
MPEWLLWARLFSHSGAANPLFGGPYVPPVRAVQQQPAQNNALSGQRPLTAESLVALTGAVPQESAASESVSSWSDTTMIDDVEEETGLPKNFGKVESVQIEEPDNASALPSLNCPQCTKVLLEKSPLTGGWVVPDRVYVMKQVEACKKLQPPIQPGGYIPTFQQWDLNFKDPTFFMPVTIEEEWEDWERLPPPTCASICTIYKYILGATSAVRILESKKNVRCTYKYCRLDAYLRVLKVKFATMLRVLKEEDLKRKREDGSNKAVVSSSEIPVHIAVDDEDKAVEPSPENSIYITDDEDASETEEFVGNWRPFTPTPEPEEPENQEATADPSESGSSLGEGLDLFDTDPQGGGGVWQYPFFPGEIPPESYLHPDRGFDEWFESTTEISHFLSARA